MNNDIQNEDIKHAIFLEYKQNVQELLSLLYNISYEEAGEMLNLFAKKNENPEK